MRDPVSNTPTGGGVWRLKWCPDLSRGGLLLAACMHAGVRILDVDRGSHDFVATGGERTRAKYTQHQSMAYGVDWCRLQKKISGQQAVIASCSFYDNLLCLWRSPPL